MERGGLTSQAILRTLCDEIGERPVGSPSNARAVAFVAKALEGMGFDVSLPEFECRHWMCRGASLHRGGEDFEVRCGPFTGSFDGSAPLHPVSSTHELCSLADGCGIVLVHGDLAKEQLMPKNFPFYRPEEHLRINDILERKALAVVAATDPDLAVSGNGPFPLIEDGDFLRPNAYMSAEDGARLLALDGDARLRIDATSLPTRGSNVVAVKGSGPRVVLMAHIDTKHGTPGALDNATGVAVLLMVADRYRGEGLRLELVVVNGEENYANPGEILFLKENEGRLNDVAVGINVDGIGLAGGAEFSLYGCDEGCASAITETMAAQGIGEGEQWVQGDHSVLFFNGVPAVAVTSAELRKAMRISHSPDDVPSMVDHDQLDAVVKAILAILDVIGGGKG